MAPEDDTDQGFLDRWARRKAADPDPQGVLPERDAPAGGTEDPPLSEAEIVAQLPDIDSLDDKSDFTPFLREGVPDLLRRKALRVLWRSNPVFASLDGMNEYDEDYTLATSALQAVKTAYQVGKGFITDEERAEMDAETSEEQSDADSPATESDPEDAVETPSQVSEPEPELLVADDESPPVRPEGSDSVAGRTDVAEDRDSRREPGSARNRRWGA